ncbi:MAG: xanthine dehydrogenase family protein subunit M [Dehalobacterium sp.]
MTRFEYYRPQSLVEATKIMENMDAGKILAGGTDLVIQLKEKKINPKKIVDISDIPELNVLIEENDGTLRIGAAVPLAQLVEDTRIKEKFPILSMAARSVGSNQVRQRGTLGGNLCNASPSADTLPALLVLDAKVRIASSDGVREVPLEKFIIGPGKTVLHSGEIVQEIIVPGINLPYQGVYLKYSRRRTVDLAIVGVAVAMICNPVKGVCQEAKIALGAVAPVPFRVREAEKLFLEVPVSTELIAEAARQCVADARPISDVRASSYYRQSLVEALVEKGLRQTWNLAGDRVSKQLEGGK